MNPERDKQAPLTGVRVSVFAFSSFSSFNLAHHWIEPLQCRL